MKSTSYRIHILSETDIPDLIALSDSVGWDYEEAELRTILSIGSVFGHKDESDQLVSCSAIIRYEESLATIGMVIVHAACRGYGLGRDLMQACIDFVSDETAIMLVATAEGQPLYESLGFVTAEYIHKCLSDHFAPAREEMLEAADEPALYPMKHDDLADVIELDGQAVGSRRSLFLQTRMKQAKTCIAAKDASGKMVGYGFAVLGPVNLVIGPIVALDSALAIRILSQLTKGHTGKVRIDVPDGQEAFLSYLQQNGFQKVAEPPVMVANTDRLPSRNGTYFGIGAQIFG
ncbi:GNAT family N-acetyltransferase [Brevibacillus sp. NRS-1366]|uniref:GNAT family N-acetyltransferase n=1 Tax=Brevibacillus sp. NRS-1366 TaxID=3233899 RepID=UPI003D197FCD